MAKETENIDLVMDTITKGVANILKRPKLGRYYVVENKEKEVVACLMVTFEMSPKLGGLIYWI